MLQHHQDSHLFWYPGHELLLHDIVRAEGCYLYDSSGKRYLDLESGVWCTSLGHGHPRILRVLTAQAAQIMHTGFCYSNELVEETAREILSLLGFENGRCVFLCSGSEAIEYGVRAVQTVARRPLLMTMKDSYFGAYGSAQRRHSEEWFNFDWMVCRDCRVSGECDESCEHWAAIPFDRIEGFLFEPGSSSGLVRFPPEKLIRKVCSVIHANDGLVLVNEVTTGVGRTGAWFGYQHYDMTPDVVALGKGIGNGYPISVAAFSSRATAKLAGQSVKYAQSHQNDPLGAAVARKVIRVIQEENLIERSRRLGDLLGAGLKRIQVSTNRIKDVRARGLMAVIEFQDDAHCSFTIATHRELVRRGFIVGRRPDVPVLRLDPPLTITPADLERFLEALESVSSLI